MVSYDAIEGGVSCQEKVAGRAGKQEAQRPAEKGENARDDEAEGEISRAEEAIN